MVRRNGADSIMSTGHLARKWRAVRGINIRYEPRQDAEAPEHQS